MFLGFYNYTTYLTYCNAISACLGIFLLVSSLIKLPPQISYYIASIFLLLSGIFDMFDGFVSRCKKSRSEEEKKNGIQIDSLADLLSFGILPILIIQSFFLDKYLSFIENKIANVLFIIITSVIYILAVLIRLSYFNIIAEKKNNCTKNKYYIGVPVTVASFVFPFLILSHQILEKSLGESFLKKGFFFYFYLFFLIIFAVLFVCKKIVFKKPKNIIYFAMILFIFFILIIFFIFNLNYYSLK
ncbi:CDP-alcohol phosphatidyltransferase family protein [Candidatus Phytoplasma pini]|uniref:CDP-diacylglycerol-serine O-phosphatidyltransferase n=1 Tax=Candidatus Phytoplasma pini TaxID=267362 RepID=A0A559KJV9_9MOLU|nr:CDP-alcohol phosphatidyltransferase family protein [Candidatus Phytoplasma pini]TVY12378.1 CDP-diacylglycerol-serine O-phosphatidyltransferase [Candidatus Phytoplasma pini]